MATLARIKEIKGTIKEVEAKKGIKKAEAAERIKVVETPPFETTKPASIEEVVGKPPKEEIAVAKELDARIQEEVKKQEVPVSDDAYQPQRESQRPTVYNTHLGQHEQSRSAHERMYQNQGDMYKESKTLSQELQEETSLHKRIHKYLRG